MFELDCRWERDLNTLAEGATRRTHSNADSHFNLWPVTTGPSSSDKRDNGSGKPQSSRYYYAPVARKRTLAQPVVLGSLIPGIQDWRGKEYYACYP